MGCFRIRSIEEQGLCWEKILKTGSAKNVGKTFGPRDISSGSSLRKEASGHYPHIREGDGKKKRIGKGRKG